LIEAFSLMPRAKARGGKAESPCEVKAGIGTEEAQLFNVQKLLRMKLMLFFISLYDQSGTASDPSLVL
jgi:hypothetical protein